MRWVRRRSTVATQVEKEAEEPRPAAMRRVERTVKVNEG
jgi:hypothetical protein